MNISATPPKAAQQQDSGMKFTYPSGSQPLSGYTIKRGIGRGGFGEVYFATSDAGKEVGLKLIRRNLDVELRGVTQCLNLKHPNLLALYDIRQDDQGDSWVVMEYVAGQSLEQVVQQHPHGMPVELVMHWMRGLSAAVAYLHDHGIVHRDLKPGNIFSDEGIVKVGDYGLSKFISCSRRSGQTGSVGTVHYMAPEVANGRYGKEIDIYAIGVILYEMLTGHVPFEGESVGEVLMKHLTAEPNLSQLQAPFQTIVARALTKDPTKRFRSVNEMLALLPNAAGEASATAHAQFHAAYDVPPEAGGAKSVNIDGDKAPKDFWHQMLFGEVEPVALAAKVGWKSVLDWIASTENPILLRCVLIVFSIFTLSIWLPVLICSVLMYGVYWILRQMVQAFYTADVTPTAVKPVGVVRGKKAAVAQRPKQPGLRRVIPLPEAAGHQAAYSYSPDQDDRPNSPTSPTLQKWRPNKKEDRLYCCATGREKAVELLGSLLKSAVIVTVLSLVALLIRGNSLKVSQFAWLALSSLTAVWGILILGKFWEARKGEEGLRRIAMAGVGLVVGAVAFWVMHALWLQLPYRPNGAFRVGREIAEYHRNFHGPDGVLYLGGFLFYFGFLFLIPRWWRQVDPLRKSRLSVGTVFLSGLCAWILTLFWAFPHPWGIMVAVIVSLGAQLSSVWLSPKERALRREAAMLPKV